MVEKRHASQAQRHLAGPPRFLQACSTRVCWQRPTHSSKRAEPRRGSQWQCPHRYLLRNSAYEIISSAWHSEAAKFPGAEFWELFHHGFHSGALPSQQLRWKKQRARTTGILQIDTDKNSPGWATVSCGAQPSLAQPSLAQPGMPGTPLSKGGTKGGETERRLRKQLE